MKRLILPILLILLPFAQLFPDGFLIPADEDYPADLLRNRVTEVTVNINGLMAETVVYQEFVNDWTETVDGTWSFPLPAGARATLLLYTRHDTTFQAILKVKSQATNPGTGSGGIAAVVNSYIGDNGITMALKGIDPGAIQKVQLTYVSMVTFLNGHYNYQYPLDADDIIDYALDHLQFDVNIHPSSTIVKYNINSHPDFQVLNESADELVLRVREPNAYCAQDFTLEWTEERSNPGLDFYSHYRQDEGGYFSMFYRSPDTVQSQYAIHRTVVFVLGNSTTMAGYKLTQSIEALSQAIELLTDADYFNIILFNSSTTKWKMDVVPGTASNIAAAKTFLNGVTSRYGSLLQPALESALTMFQGGDFSNSIIVLTDGITLIDPLVLRGQNTQNVAIFPIGIGDNIDRSRLELTASNNYGFVTYIDESDNIGERIGDAIRSISQPVLRNTAINFNKPDVGEVFPPVFPSAYAGNYFLVTGRYETPGTATANISGTGLSGTVVNDFACDYATASWDLQVPRIVWAKEKMDDLENTINIYGETDALKDSLIELSLFYNIRCKYTAYVADYTNEYTMTSNPEDLIPKSFIAGNYPNPFNPVTTLRFYLDNSVVGKVKLLKIYNILGQLVAVIDISSWLPGYHEIQFDGKDYYGHALPSGIYLVSLQVGNQIVGTHRIQLLK